MKRKLIATSLLCGAILCAGAPLAAAGGALSAEKRVTVNTSPETAWKMVGHYNHLDVWHPAVVISDLTGKAREKGAVRVLTLTDGGKITEMLLRHSGRDKSYTYKITDSPLPVANYESTLSVKPAADSKAAVIWSGTFDAKGVSDEKAVEVISGVYAAGLAHVARNF